MGRSLACITFVICEKMHNSYFPYVTHMVIIIYTNIILCLLIEAKVGKLSLIELEVLILSFNGLHWSNLLFSWL